MKNLILLLTFFLAIIPGISQDLKINEQGYFEVPGLYITVFNDRYAEGHGGGLIIWQNGVRTASNGDLRLEPTPGQWTPMPKFDNKTIDEPGKEVSVTSHFPDSAINNKGFNPVIYPDLCFKYQITARAVGKKVIVTVDLDEPLPSNWEDKVGFNLELFPGDLFGKTWYMDQVSGIFPAQPNGPVIKVGNCERIMEPLAKGRMLTITPDSPERTIRIESKGEELQLLDGRVPHNNGWFVVRSLVAPGKTRNAVEWVIEANSIENFVKDPTLHINQVGYHPEQEKVALIEQDKTDEKIRSTSLIRFSESGTGETVKAGPPESWGDYMNSTYYKFDFSDVKREGVYKLKYGEFESQPFRIAADIYDRHVWQPTLAYWFPIQMCHMRVNEGFRTWHGLCHMDDALMAPDSLNHFDGYLQAPSSLCKYKPGEHVPGLNLGGWHDAGDDDLRSESQAGAIWSLSIIYELFKNDWDETTVDQHERVVELHRPDGKDDTHQQIEHGLLSLVSSYGSMGRMYRGIIVPTLRQYQLLGDWVVNTDGQVFDPAKDRETYTPCPGILDNRWEFVKKDDRMVFTEHSPLKELSVVEGLAAGSRIMKGYNDELAVQSLQIAEEMYHRINLDDESSIDKTAAFVSANSMNIRRYKIKAAIELFISTGKEEYKNDILKLVQPEVLLNNQSTTGQHGYSSPQGIANALETGKMAAYLSRVIKVINDKKLTQLTIEAAKAYKKEVDALSGSTPYGVPYPEKLGVSWLVQDYAATNYFLYKAFPGIYDGTVVLNALHFILGLHPGDNNSSYVSGVGSKSVTNAYGFNRADGGYIPGGTVIGTNLIQPGYFELKDWPYLWQQTEYVLDQPVYNCGGAAHFMMLVLAAQDILKQDLRVIK